MRSSSPPPPTRTQAAFATLLLAQAAHSLEEYAGRLWETLPPARAVSGLFSDDLERGFIFANACLLAFGVWCLAWPVRRGWPSAVPLAWTWVAVEAVNGTVHPLWTLRQGGYTPGVGTAPLLLGLSVYLGSLLRSAERRVRSDAGPRT